MFADIPYRAKAAQLCWGGSVHFKLVAMNILITIPGVSCIGIRIMKNLLRSKGDRLFLKIAAIFSTVSGMSSFIYANVDLNFVRNFSGGNETVSMMLVNLDIPVFSFLVGAVLGFYDRKYRYEFH